MGGKVIVGAQIRQLQKEKDGSNETVLKKLRDRKEKMRGAQGALEVQTSGAELSGNDLADIIKFIWPRYDLKCAPSKLTSKAKRMEKLAEIKSSHGKGVSWSVLLLQQQLDKASSELAAEEAGIGSGSDLWNELHLDDDSGSESDSSVQVQDELGGNELGGESSMPM